VDLQATNNRTNYCDEPRGGKSHSIRRDRERGREGKLGLLTDFLTNDFESLCETETRLLGNEKEEKRSQHLTTLRLILSSDEAA
jgi:hypothetical protein